MANVTVIIYWREKGRGEWKHQVEPEEAEGMVKALERGDEWVTWKTQSRQRQTSSVYTNTFSSHRIRSEEILGISVFEYKREESRF